MGGGGWLGIAGQRYRIMTFVRVVLLLVGLFHCTYQGRCLVAAESVMRKVSQFHSHHWIEKWAVFPFPGLH